MGEPKPIRTYFQKARWDAEREPILTAEQSKDMVISPLFFCTLSYSGSISIDFNSCSISPMTINFTYSSIQELRLNANFWFKKLQKAFLITYCPQLGNIYGHSYFRCTWNHYRSSYLRFKTLIVPGIHFGPDPACLIYTRSPTEFNSQNTFCRAI